MSPIKINPNSWHFKLVREADQFDIPDDICTYTRRLLGMIALMVFLFTMSAALLFLLGNALGWLAWCIAWLDWVMPDASALAGLCFILLGLIAAIGHIPRERRPAHKPGFVRIAWRHFHEKTCAKLEFSEDA